MFELLTEFDTNVLYENLVAIIKSVPFLKLEQWKKLSKSKENNID